MHLIFNHGKESGPDGGKIRALAGVAGELGHDTESIDYRDLPDDADARVERLCARMDALGAPPFLIGSSMGAYVALVAAERRPAAGLFLMAPAAYLDGWRVQTFTPRGEPTTIVHGWGDELIPWRNALRLAEATGGELHLLHAGHRLAGVHDVLGALLATTLARVPA